MPELVRENDKIIGIKPNLFWAFVMAGVEGPTGKVWVPEINNGILSWKESNTPPSSTSISDLKGPAGDTPIIGIKRIHLIIIIIEQYLLMKNWMNIWR